MDIRMSPEADKSMSLKNAWEMMQQNSIVSLPIRDKDGKLEAYHYWRYCKDLYG